MSLSSIIAVALVAVVFIAGLSRTYYALYTVVKKEEFAEAFREKFGKYFKSRGEDFEAYEHLLRQANRMQEQLGQ